MNRHDQWVIAASESRDCELLDFADDVAQVLKEVQPKLRVECPKQHTFRRVFGGGLNRVLLMARHWSISRCLHSVLICVCRACRTVTVLSS